MSSSVMYGMTTVLAKLPSPPHTHTQPHAVIGSDMIRNEEESPFYYVAGGWNGRGCMAGSRKTSRSHNRY